MQVAVSQAMVESGRHMGSPATLESGGHKGSLATMESGVHRGAPDTVETGDHSAKKPRLEEPVKQEIAVRQPAGAVVPAEHGPRMEATFKMEVTVFHCPICLCPFKPPVFQCKRGHLACGGCHAGTCGKCKDGSATFDVPNTAMDGVVSTARVQCSNDGCEMSVPYHEVQDHQSVCPHAPCWCIKPGCYFVGPRLVTHLAAAHAMPVTKVPYGKVHRIQVTVPELARHLLVGARDEGGAFLLALDPLRASTVVTAVCLRAEACPSPRYTVKMWVNGPPLAAPAPNRKADIVLADFEATSSATPGAVAFDDLTSYLTVPPRYLIEGTGPSKEMSLHIRIERTISSSVDAPLLITHQ